MGNKYLRNSIDLNDDYRSCEGWQKLLNKIKHNPLADYAFVAMENEEKYLRSWMAWNNDKAFILI